MQAPKGVYGSESTRPAPELGLDKEPSGKE